MEELEQLLCNYCELPAAGGVENGYGKVNILLQTYIGRGEVDSFSLISDLSYVAQVRKQTTHGLSSNFPFHSPETPSHLHEARIRQYM